MSDPRCQAEGLPDHIESEVARREGLLKRIYIDGELAADGLCLRPGRAYFQFIPAHAPRFDDHRLGFLCSNQSVAACIERGATEFHFLGGATTTNTCSAPSHAISIPW